MQVECTPVNQLLLGNMISKANDKREKIRYRTVALRESRELISLNLRDERADELY